MINHRLGLPAGRLAVSKWMLFIHLSGTFIVFFFYLFFIFFVTRPLIYRGSTSFFFFISFSLGKKKDCAYLKGITSGQY